MSTPPLSMYQLDLFTDVAVISPPTQSTQDQPRPPRPSRTSTRPTTTNHTFDHYAFFMSLTQQDHTDAINMLYSLARRAVRHLAPRTTHAEDIVQNAVIRMYKAATSGKLSPTRNPHSFFTRIVLNEKNRLYGKNKKHWQHEVNISDYV